MWTDVDCSIKSLLSLHSFFNALLLFVVSEDAEEDCNPEEGLPCEGRRDVHNAAPGAVLSAALRPSGKAETSPSTAIRGCLSCGRMLPPLKALLYCSLLSPIQSHPCFQMVLSAGWDTPALKLDIHGSTSSSRTLLGASRAKEGKESPRVRSDLI